MKNFLKKISVQEGNSEAVTFKISPENKQKLVKDAEQIGLSLSEYIRIKVLIDDINLKKLISDNLDLQKKVKENLVKATLPITNEVDSQTINLKTTEEGLKVMGILLTELRDREFLMPKKVRYEDNDIANAISVIVFRYLASYLEEFDELRNTYGITSDYQFYELLFKPLYEEVWPQYTHEY